MSRKRRWHKPQEPENNIVEVVEEPVVVEENVEATETVDAPQTTETVTESTAEENVIRTDDMFEIPLPNHPETGDFEIEDDTVADGIITEQPAKKCKKGKRFGYLRWMVRDGRSLLAFVLALVCLTASLNQYSQVQVARHFGYYTAPMHHSIEDGMRQVAQDDAYTLINLWQTGNAAGLNDWEYSHMQGNIGEVVLYEDGEQVYASNKSDSYTTGWEYKFVENSYYVYDDGQLSVVRATADELEQDVKGYYTYNSDEQPIPTSIGSPYTKYYPETAVTIAIDYDLPGYDHYSNKYQEIKNAYNMRYFDIVLLVLAGLATLACCGYLYLRRRVYLAIVENVEVSGDKTAESLKDTAKNIGAGVSTGYHKSKTFLEQWEVPRKIWKALVRIADRLGVLPLLVQYALWVLFYAWLFLVGIWGQSVFLLGLFALAGVAHGAYITWQTQKLCNGVEQLAEGDLGFQVDTDRMQYQLKRAGENINCIADGVQIAVEERTKSERMKTELITNVSHDIKTPLTSIINYVDLIEKEPTDNPTITEYATVLHRQSERLKKLIEDLVEASKASTGNVEVHWEDCDLQVLVSQMVAEYQHRLEGENLTLVVKQPEHPVTITADGKLLWRILDNLMNNVCKYAQPHTRVFFQLEQELLQVRLTIKNTSKYPLDLSEEELKERFVRGDASRSTEGNGLGLSIAQSLSELQNGNLQLITDGDLFKVVLCFPNKA